MAVYSLNQTWMNHTTASFWVNPLGVRLPTVAFAEPVTNSADRFLANADWL